MRAWDFPHDTVIVACRRCSRRGRYPKERFLQIVGRDTHMAAARWIIAADCPNRSKTPGNINSACGIYYPVLERRD